MEPATITAPSWIGGGKRFRRRSEAAKRAVGTTNPTPARFSAGSAVLRGRIRRTLSTMVIAGVAVSGIAAASSGTVAPRIFALTFSRTVP